MLSRSLFSVYSSRPSVGGNSGTWGNEAPKAPKSEARRAENRGRRSVIVLNCYSAIRLLSRKCEVSSVSVSNWTVCIYGRVSSKKTTRCSDIETAG